MALSDYSEMNDNECGEKTYMEKTITNVVSLNYLEFNTIKSSPKASYLFENNGSEFVLSRNSIRLTIKNHSFLKFYEAQLQINGICYKPCETIFLAKTLAVLLSYIRIEARTEKFQEFVGIVEKNRIIKALDKWFPY